MEEYVDRVKETQHIIDLVTKQDATQLIIIGAPTGIGKSSLAKKVLAILRNSLTCVRVPTAQINKTASTEQGAFLKRVFAELCEKHKDNPKLAFHSYVFGIKDSSAKKRTMNIVMESALSSGSGVKRISKFALKRLLKIGEFDYKTLLYSYNTDFFRVMSEYIEYVLSEKRHLVNIDGLQNIDSISQSCLIQWVKACRISNGAFLLEYTISPEGNSTIKEFKDALSDHFDEIETIRLSCLDNNNALEAALMEVQVEKPRTSDGLSFYQKSANGNIRKLIDFFLNEQFSQNRHYDNSSDFDPTRELLGSGTTDELSLLFVILLHKGRIEKEKLACLINSPKSLFNNAYSIDSVLSDSRFVTEDNGVCEIAHPSILDSVSEIKKHNRSAYYTAYQSVVSYYQVALKSKHVKDPKYHESVVSLLELYLENDRSMLLSILPDLRQLTLNAVDRRRTLEYVQSTIALIIDDKEDYIDVYYSVIEICIDLEFFSEALEFLHEIEFLEKDKVKFIFYKSSLLISNEEFSEAIDYIDESLVSNRGKLIEAYLILFKIISLKSQYRSFDTFRLEKRVEELSKSFHNLQFEGYFMRVSEISKPRLEAIPDLKRSVECFKRINMKKQAAKSNLSLGFLYAIQGSFRDAFTCYQNAEDVLCETPALFRHIFCVNSSAILLLQGNTTRDVWRLLEEAEITAQTNTSKAAIQINKLAYCIEIGDMKNASSIANVLKKLMRFDIDLQFKAIAYYNLHLFYTRAKQVDLSKLMLKKATSLQDECNTLKCRLNKSIPEDGTTILLNHDWHVCFLSLLNIDYTETEDSLQRAISISSPIISE